MYWFSVNDYYGFFNFQFLTENGYRHPISVKILHTPTSKDFYRIFEVCVVSLS